ncbi:FGGY family carbohydrate kinase [Hyphomicrobium sp.]|uniref:FGGY-family carbohydrate kinase n=1 Tax=Hyphomicrobium sp. TaxID=82 RepID=UPI001D8BE1D5|nr:FGGY family carbohydrate kinase [Hyphomicrobium sp.]MBY0561039.1 glycerol kinase [Hyphomicrobium sp.]
MRVAAIDQGTTSTRVLVADTDGTVEIACSITHQQIHPHPGWVEHDPEELLSNIRACLQAAGAVDAIGIDNQGESCLAWDARTGAALSPVIVWQDNRTADVIERLKAAGAEALTLARAGLPLDAYFSASKLAWIINTLPAAKAALDAGHLRLGTTDAFFLDRLTGTFATDVTTASRTSLMNLETGQWDEELCQLFGVPMSCLPKIMPTVADYGRVDGVPITAAVVDQQAALFGHGCRKPGDAKITFGTGAFALTVTGDKIARAPEKGLLPTVAWSIDGQMTYAVDGGVYDAGSAIEWARRIGLVTDLTADLDWFDCEPAIERGVVFVPALSGLACPHWDRTAASLFLGMSAATTRADLCQALLEGIALSAADVVGAMDAHVAIGRSIAIDGGLARSRYFAQFLADMIGRDVVATSFDERTAFGTASLAARGAGFALPEPETVSRTFSPRAGDNGKIRARFSEAVSRAKGWRDHGGQQTG